jgi:hypothetical protein
VRSWAVLTTPPAPRPSSEKSYPLFTRDVFSTKSFGPGHIIGGVLLAGGLYVAIKALVDRGRAQQAARAQNERGQYGGRT